MNVPSNLAESCSNNQTQFSAAAASWPVEGVAGDQETAASAEVEGSNTWRKMGPIRVSSGERGEGKWEMTRREEAA
jgi:hypothetical protein